MSEEIKQEKSATEAPAAEEKKAETRGGKSADTWTCPECGDVVNAKGKAGHIAFKHGKKKLDGFIRKVEPTKKKVEAAPVVKEKTKIVEKVDDKETNFILKAIIAFVGVMVLIYLIIKIFMSRAGDIIKAPKLPEQEPQQAPNLAPPSSIDNIPVWKGVGRR